MKNNNKNDEKTIKLKRKKIKYLLTETIKGHDPALSNFEQWLQMIKWV